MLILTKLRRQDLGFTLIRSAAAAILFFVFLTIGGCTSINEKKTAGCSKTVLGLVPDFAKSVILTSDKRHMVHVKQVGSNSIVYLDSKQLGPEFEGVLVDNSFVISSTGLRTAYAVGKEDPTNPCTTCGPQGKWHAVIDGQPGPEYDKVVGLSFSPDESHVAYGAIIKKIDPEQPQSKDEWALVVDGQETPIPYEAVSYRSPAYTPDGRLVYIAKKADKAVVVVDSKEQQAYDKIGQPIPVFSADGKKIAYSARNFGRPEVAVLNGKAGPGFDYIPPRSLVFSPDGCRLAYGARYENQQWSVVVDGNIGEQYDQVDKIVFSPNGKHYAYNAQHGGQWYLIVDGREIVEGEQLGEDFAVFSPDSTRIAHAVGQNGKWKVVTVELDDSGGKTANFVAEIGGGYNREPGSITFSPDSWRIAYEAAGISSAGFQGKSRFVVVDGQPKPVYDGLIPGSVTFSADSKHVLYTVIRGNERQAVIDGRPSPPYRAIYSVLRHGESGFELLVRDNELYRVFYEPSM